MSDSKEPPEQEQVDPAPAEQLGKKLDQAREGKHSMTPEEARERARKVIDTYPDKGGIAIGSISGSVTIGDSYAVTSVNEARQIFIDSIRKRDDFMSVFLNQALRQANTTFNLSIYFMILGGLIVLVAAVLAVGRFAGSPSHGIALVSGLGGLLIGTSGAAFSRRADKARKHLSQQAAMMQSQLLNEQKFSQVIDLLTGIRDDHLNDQARMTLATRLMDELNENSRTGPSVAAVEPKKRRGRNRMEGADLFRRLPALGAPTEPVLIRAVKTGRSRRT